MRWMIFNVLLLLAVAGGWLHSKGVPVEQGVGYAYRTAQAPTEWDRYDWTAIGAGLVSVALWWRKRPAWLRRRPNVPQAPETASAILDQYRDSVRRHARGYVDEIRKMMKNGQCAARWHNDPGEDIRRCIKAMLDREFGAGFVRETHGQGGYGMGYGWSASFKQPEPDIPF